MCGKNHGVDEEVSGVDDADDDGGVVTVMSEVVLGEGHGSLRDRDANGMEWYVIT